MAGASELAVKGDQGEDKQDKEEMEGEKDEEEEGASAASASEIEDPNKTKRATCEVSVHCSVMEVRV